MKRAVDELGRRETFRGYGPEQGYEFLRSTIAQHDYRDREIEIADDEIFVSDGSKCDCGYILDILGDQNKIAITDPVYPVYVDTNVMAGPHRPGAAKTAATKASFICRAPRKIISFPSRQTNMSISFIFVSRTIRQVRWHRASSLRAGSITRASTTRFCCSTPPTRRTSPIREIPHSIFEIPGARECAIEFRSFSKNGGFTGVRCGFTVMPKIVAGANGERPTIAAASTLASALEHEIEQRELSGATRRRSVVFG